MAIKQQLNLSQSQNLALTPALMQAIKLLQLGHLELTAFVENELEQNPLLELKDAHSAEQDSEQHAEQDNKVDGDFNADFTANDTIGSAEKIADNFDTDVDNVFPEQVGQDSISQSTSINNANNATIHLSGDAPNIGAYVAQKLTLSDHLWDQAVLMFDNRIERLIARFLIDSLDEAGYLSSDISNISSQLGISEDKVSAILSKLQTCDPIGVFCKDLRECMAIQLSALDRLDPMMAGLLDNLNLVLDHDLTKLSKIINASMQDIADMLLELRNLNPKPGQAFDVSQTQTIIADVFVKQANDGVWKIELNSDILPQVLVNRTYFATVKQKLRAKSEKEYLVDCLQSANWLIKSLDQRAKTILKVATEIVRQQDSFLIHGITHLKPMTLKMVADEIEMHESTVSRVTANKYISTPRGIFEMKYFFTTGLSSSSGANSHSSEAARHIIKQMIDEEKVDSVLSDEKISKLLRTRYNIDVARRTVMKYRESLNFASSVVRKRQKKQNII